ncbi:Rieske (2Fe-2S) protein [Microlunatus panaciterrae]
MGPLPTSPAPLPSPSPFHRSRLSRRSFLAGVGVSLVATGPLSGCTLYGQPQQPSPQGPPTQPRPSAGALALASAIPIGGGEVFDGPQVVVTQPTQGSFKAFTAVCTHQGCLVGSVTDTINCPCHGSRFSIADGSVVAGPALAPLAARKITVAHGQIVLG